MGKNNQKKQTKCLNKENKIRANVLEDRVRGDDKAKRVKERQKKKSARDLVLGTV